MDAAAVYILSFPYLTILSFPQLLMKFYEEEVLLIRFQYESGPGEQNHCFTYIFSWAMDSDQ